MARSTAAYWLIGILAVGIIAAVAIIGPILGSNPNVGTAPTAAPTTPAWQQCLTLPTAVKYNITLAANYFPGYYNTTTVEGSIASFGAGSNNASMAVSSALYTYYGPSTTIAQTLNTEIQHYYNIFKGSAACTATISSLTNTTYTINAPGVFCITSQLSIETTTLSALLINMTGFATTSFIVIRISGALNVDTANITYVVPNNTYYSNLIWLVTETGSLESTSTTSPHSLLGFVLSNGLVTLNSVSTYLSVYSLKNVVVPNSLLVGFIGCIPNTVILP